MRKIVLPLGQIKKPSTGQFSKIGTERPKNGTDLGQNEQMFYLMAVSDLAKQDKAKCSLARLSTGQIGQMGHFFLGVVRASVRGHVWVSGRLLKGSIVAFEKSSDGIPENVSNLSNLSSSRTSKARFSLMRTTQIAQYGRLEHLFILSQICPKSVPSSVRKSALEQEVQRARKA